MVTTTNSRHATAVTPSPAPRHWFIIADCIVTPPFGIVVISRHELILYRWLFAVIYTPPRLRHCYLPPEYTPSLRRLLTPACRHASSNTLFIVSRFEWVSAYRTPLSLSLLRHAPLVSHCRHYIRFHYRHTPACSSLMYAGYAYAITTVLAHFTDTAISRFISGELHTPLRHLRSPDNMFRIAILFSFFTSHTQCRQTFGHLPRRSRSPA